MLENKVFHHFKVSDVQEPHLKQIDLRGFVPVSKQDFYKIIGDQDICVTSKFYPYSRFETRNRVEVGRAISRDGVGDEEYSVTEYFMVESFYQQHKHLAGR